MARTLYLNDGSTEYVFAGMTEEADGHYNTLMDVMNELEAALAKPRLNRKEVERICSDLRSNL